MKTKVGDYVVSISPSIFTHRAGKTDIRFALTDCWGWRAENGQLYTTRLTLAAESRKSIGARSDPVPQEVIDAAFAICQ